MQTKPTQELFSGKGDSLFFTLIPVVFEHEAARNAAMIYSFLGTCKINNVEPYARLIDVLTRMPDHSIQHLEELLPGYQN